MGIWEWMGSTAESVKRNTPDAWTPVKNGCIASYGYGWSAFTKADQAVRNNAPNWSGQWVPDEETRSKMGLYTTKFAKNAGLYALQEGYKIIPGGAAFSKIISNTLKDVNHEKLIDEKLKVLEKKLHTPKECSKFGPELSEGKEIQGGVGVSATAGCRAEWIAGRMTPEDVIRVFMMKEFIGNRFLDDLMVSNSTKGKKRQ